jgi:hypothetical protein
MAPGYDIIGDIHGYADRLEALLAKMGYRKRDGVWNHPERTAVFVGDYVDRGPENLRACRIVMAMTEASSALAILGNHDFNAVCMATPDPLEPGSYLRRHTKQNLQQTAATRAEMERSPVEADAVLDWMRRLPLWIEHHDWRVAHAGWSRRAMATLEPIIDSNTALSGEGFVRAARKGDPVRGAREVLLNGPEADLPNDMSYLDPDGHRRTNCRLAWWKARQDLTWRDAVLAGDEVIAQLPEQLLPNGLLDPLDDDPRPLFFGHYWMTAPLVLQTPWHACVDASVANGGKLAAYQYSMENPLEVSRFVYA